MDTDNLPPELQAAVDKSQMRLAYQEIVEKITNQCWDKCVTDPSTPLNPKSDGQCVRACAAGYLATSRIVSQRISQALNEHTARQS